MSDQSILQLSALSILGSGVIATVYLLGKGIGALLFVLGVTL